MELKQQSSTIPRVAGIYQIRCRKSGRVYVGSSVNLHERWVRHVRALRCGTHHNYLLQRAWNAHGEANFKFTLLEHAPIDQLLECEQVWINRHRCTHRSRGFNLAPRACSTGKSLAKTWPGFYNPEGLSVTIVNLHDFCLRRNMDFPSMLRLSQGRSKLKSYKGWTHENSIRKRAYIKRWTGFIDPTGTACGPITNLAQFCRTHGLCTTHMVAVANGRITSHRGWTHQQGKQRQPPLVHQDFIAPDGTRPIITNLRAFCRTHGLAVTHMFEVKSGKRPSHKGWRWSKHDAYEAPTS